MPNKKRDEKPGKFRLPSGYEVLACVSILLLAVVLVLPLRPRYEAALEKSMPSLMFRVMDRLAEHQERYREAHGKYATGVFDADNNIRTISDNTGWNPGLRKGIVYTVESEAPERYRVLAKFPDGSVLGRTYPLQTKNTP